MTAESPRRPIVLPQAKTLLGVFCAGLVLLLSVLAASPAAHEQICHHDSAPAEADGVCAVDLFAHGFEPGLAQEGAAAPVALEGGLVEVPLELHLQKPGLLLPFACGPPAA